MHPHVRVGAAPHAAWATVPTDEQVESPTGRKAPFVISPSGCRVPASSRNEAMASPSSAQ